MSQSTVNRPSSRMSPAAKSWLAETVRSLRARLLKDLNDGLESTYRLGIPASRADLDQEKSQKRQRLEDWLDEQARAHNRGHKETPAQARLRHRESAVKLVAATWLNRLVVLGQMEALGLVRIPVFTGGINSKGFQEFREFAPALSAESDESYPFLLHLAFEELALDLPGLFGQTGLTGLLPMPTSTLRHLIDTLQADNLSSSERLGLWRDDTLLGWVYQFWNDPEREDLDEKIRNGGKIENHEIAAKTQLFTDRYMVEWLLQNSLGQIWLELCLKNGWTAEVVATGTLDALGARRADWRGRRERGEVDEEALMPLESELEERWKYYVPRPISAGDGVPARLCEMKILDPACGSGHFLVIAFDLLAELYREEAAQRGESMAREEIARSIVENNLHGLDIDPRAVQIAAAALWLKVKTFAPKAQVGHLNLVASNLGLASLAQEDAALVELVTQVEAETGISQELTLRLVETLKGADHLGSLLKVGEALDRAVLDQAPLLVGRALSLEEARGALLSRLEEFVSYHSRSEDLGLRLRGEQLASGVRFIRLVREGQYHLVVGNPPYQNGGKTAESGYLARHYPEGKADLYSAFLQRSLQFCRPGGFSSLLTLRGWLFFGIFEKLRARLLRENSLMLLGDLDRGAFELILDEVVAVIISLFRRGTSSNALSVAILPTPREDRTRDSQRTERKRVALLAGFERFEFRPEDLRAIPGLPLIYWWDSVFLARYRSVDRIGEKSPARKGLCTGDDGRFNCLWWEVATDAKKINKLKSPAVTQADGKSTKLRFVDSWAPTVKGAKGVAWFEPFRDIVRWKNGGLENRTFDLVSNSVAVRNPSYYFCLGVAFSMIGSSFTARAHRYRSVFADKGASVFPEDVPGTLCLMNSSLARYVMESLNPSVCFQVGDVNRLPLFPIESADEIVATLDRAFTQHEQARETSVEFRRPGPSPWKYAQEWAQIAVDRPAGTRLPEYMPKEEPQGPLDELSYHLGLALGRFDENGIAQHSPDTALPHGILFLSASGGPGSLEHPAAASLREHGAYLRTKFFADDHLKRYEKRPIYFPLSSEKKNFVAWCSIHRWTDQTLQHLLADHLIPEQNRLAAELADAAEARNLGDRKSQVAAQKRHDDLLALLSELQAFLKTVQDIAERGAHCPGCTPREVDAPFRMDLDDGVMINSAALWPLLLPQGWKDPKNWWTELCNAKGKKDYDWSHLAARYFPKRVDEKCQKDPSLAVAHGVFWKYHPEKAFQWELRLQSPDELGPDFRLNEPGSDAYRADFQNQNPDKVRELREGEQRRRDRKENAPAESDQGELDFADEEETEE